MKLALGTAQFGLHYGIANSLGRIGLAEATRVVALARKGGVETLDTAIAYGESESCLGSIGVQGFNVITKLPALPTGISDATKWLTEEVQKSISRLKVDSIYGLLLHRSENLRGSVGRSIDKVLKQLKNEGLVKKVGISIYSPKELNEVIGDHEIDIVQAPMNLLDHRLETSGWLRKLEVLDIELHVRSVFLQGLLLMPNCLIPSKFNHWSHIFESWSAWQIENRVTPLEACLAFVASKTGIDTVVMGVDNAAHLSEIMRVFNSISLYQFPDLRCDDERLINPSYWSNL